MVLNAYTENSVRRYKMTRIASFLFALALLTGCASVKVVPLKPDGTKADNQVEGVRYYLPKPYLLIVQVPFVKLTGNDDKKLDDPDSEKAKKKPTGGAPAKPTPKQPPDDSKTDTSTSSPGATGNTSFQKETAQYAIKLIYLPDFCHPMAIQESAGLWGSAQMKPTLQDGWMLTSLDASTDSKTAETITSIASLVSAIKGAKTSDSGTKALSETSSNILNPGLYEFAQNAGSLGIRRVTTFVDGGAKNEGNVTIPCSESAQTR
jgi:hypothetical protein